VEEKLRVNENVLNKRAQEIRSAAVSRCDNRRTLLYTRELMLSGKIILKPPYSLSSKETNFTAKNLYSHFSFRRVLERILQSVERQKQCLYALGSCDRAS